MPEPPQLQRALFKELNSELTQPKSGGNQAEVQFNPETLKVSFANQLVQPATGGDQRGQPARQFVGAGTTKLSLTLVFDVTAPPYSDQGKSDVRELTQQVAYFITPQAADGSGSGSSAGAPGGGQQTQLVPPGVRFLWGSFQFDGMMDSLEENLEYFSADGKPLRATLAVALSQQKITRFFDPNQASAGTGAGLGGRSPVGTTPLLAASAGATLQGMADVHGPGTSWQAIASANGIENPRQLGTGQLISLKANVSI